MTIPSGVVTASSINTDVTALYNSLVALDRSGSQLTVSLFARTGLSGGSNTIGQLSFVAPDDMTLLGLGLFFTDGTTGSFLEGILADSKGNAVATVLGTTATTSASSFRSPMAGYPDMGPVLVKGTTYTMTITYTRSGPSNETLTSASLMAVMTNSRRRA